MTAPLPYGELAKKFLRNEPINRHEEGTTWSHRSDEAGRRYFSLQYAIGKGTMLKEVPALFAAVVKSGDWQKWVWAGQERQAPSLGEYITRKSPNGLGASLEMARDWVRNDPEALAIFTKQTTDGHGGNRSSKVDSINLAKPTGTSRAYTVRRLREQREDLYQQVTSGKLSVNQAAMKAGWREGQKPFAIMKRYVHKLTDAEWQDLVELRASRKCGVP
jgi:hypothetical protein